MQTALPPPRPSATVHITAAIDFACPWCAVSIATVRSPSLRFCPPLTAAPQLHAHLDALAASCPHLLFNIIYLPRIIFPYSASTTLAPTPCMLTDDVSLALQGIGCCDCLTLHYVTRCWAAAGYAHPPSPEREIRDRSLVRTVFVSFILLAALAACNFNPIAFAHQTPCNVPQGAQARVVLSRSNCFFRSVSFRCRQIGVVYIRSRFQEQSF
jgi:hypothetical protein